MTDINKLRHSVQLLGIDGHADADGHVGFDEADLFFADDRDHLLEAAEKERDWHAERCEDAMNECDALRAELAQLRKESDKFDDGIDWIQRALQAEALIEEVGRQEPVAWMNSRNGFITKDNKNPDYNLPLYLAPGAREKKSEKCETRHQVYEIERNPDTVRMS